MSTGRWSELSGEHEVRVTAMSKTSGVAEGLYGLVVCVSGPKIRQEFPFYFLPVSRFSSSASKSAADRRQLQYRAARLYATPWASIDT